MKNDKGIIGDSGAVMLEYVIVLLIFSSLMMAWSSMIYSTQWGFGPLGLEIVYEFQRLMAAISLPVP